MPARPCLPLALLLLLPTAAPAAAQAGLDAPHGAPPVAAVAPAAWPPASPAWRLDVDLFTPGMGLVLHEAQDDWIVDPDGRSLDAMIAGQIGLRFARRSGHGFYLNGGFFSAISPTYLVGEAGYLHRFRLVGDDARGLGIDLSAGLTGGHGDTGNRDGGLRGGANAGLSLDWRGGGFVVGGEVRTRLLGGPGGPELVTTVMGRLTFGFWGM
jgi:hypothetical protein